MADAELIALIFQDAVDRGVPFVLSSNGRVAAYALPPDYALVRYQNYELCAGAELRQVLGWPTIPCPQELLSKHSPTHP